MRQEIRERIEQIRRGEVPEGYKRTKVGVIPEDWSEGSLGDLFEFEGGYPASREQLSEEGICYLHYGDLHKNPRNYIDVDKDLVLIPKLNEEINNIPSKYFLQDGDIVFADASEDYEGIGKSVVIYNKKNIPFVSGLHTIVARDKKNLIVRDYKRYAFLIHEVRKQFMTYASGISVYGISRSNLKKIKIAYPDKNEQKKVAQILSAWDKAIELKEKLIEQKKLQKKGLMQLLLTGKVRWNDANIHSKQDLNHRLSLIQRGEVPDGYQKTKFGIVPKDWEVRKAKQIFENYVDKNHGGMLEVLSVTQDRGAIPRSQLEIDIKYDESSVINYKKVNMGDFIISLRSFQGGIEYSRYEGIISPAYTVIRNIINIDKDYYRYLFKSKSFVSRLSAVVYGIRDGKQIGFSDFGEMYLPYPPIEEQQKIAQILSTLDKSIHLLEQELEALKQQKKGLMQLLLTGIVRVHELEKVECLTLCSS